MSHLNILSGGAAHGLVASLAPTFAGQTGFDIKGEFGAVGGMAEKLRRGVAADLVILTSALVAELAAEKLVLPTSIKDVGLVETALAVRSGDAKIAAKNADELRAAFLAADAVYVPDVKASTAGSHIANVLARLGIAPEIATRLKIHPNGATAMRELAASAAKRPIGCTQATEIIATKGVELSGSLPSGCELITTYAAAVTTGAAHPRQAETLIELLTGPSAAQTRHSAGFL
jgi:molybdate transport system substrate-binding protein